MEGFVAEGMFWSLIGIVVCILLKIGVGQWQEIWVKPERIRSMLLKQGIKGPKPRFFLGNIHEMQSIQSKLNNNNNIEPVAAAAAANISHNAWAHSIFPYLHRWAQDYGPIYMYSTWKKQHLYIAQPEIMKALNLHKTLDLGKPIYLTKSMEPMLGDGIIKANGPHWAFQRKIIAPQFFPNKAKHMLGLMEECTMSMIKSWMSQIEISEGGVADIIVDKDLKSLSADIISKACFGSSYSHGKVIFSKLGALQEAMSRPSLLFGLPNFRFLPTKSNRKIWRLQKEVEALIMEIVNARREERERSSKSQQDLLEAILESAENSEDLHHTRKTNCFIVDNCKNIYFAGHETTALTASWTLMLLALYPQWQHRVRAELVEIFGDRLNDCLLDLDKLRQLKTLTMVIQETLRLYAPAIIISREVFEDMRLGNTTVPKGTNIWTMVTTLHRDPENWGSDANEFKPERFAQGIPEACKYPQSYIPFGFGTRLCVGQTFAMLELKMLLSLIISNFCFSLSPHYQHSPIYRMLLVPQHGIRLLVSKVQEMGEGAKYD